MEQCTISGKRSRVAKSSRGCHRQLFQTNQKSYPIPSVFLLRKRCQTFLKAVISLSAVHSQYEN